MMNKEKQAELFEKYVFLDCEEIECEDGWFHLLDELFEDMSMLKMEGIRIIQVKEKVGELRVYTRISKGSRERVEETVLEMIQKATEQSNQICELCGNRGRERSRFLNRQTRCDDCFSRS